MKKLPLFLLFAILMAGSALAQSSHSVTLNWTQSTTPGVTGNGVYVSLTSATGPWSLLTQSLAPMVTYTDNTVASGKTYFYAVTALAGSAESVKSNAVTALVPANPFAPTSLTLGLVQ